MTYGKMVSRSQTSLVQCLLQVGSGLRVDIEMRYSVIQHTIQHSPYWNRFNPSQYTQPGPPEEQRYKCVSTEPRCSKHRFLPYPLCCKPHYMIRIGKYCQI